MNTREFNSAILVRSLGISKEVAGIIFDQIDDLAKRIEYAEKELKEAREKLLTAQADNVRLRNIIKGMLNRSSDGHKDQIPESVLFDIESIGQQAFSTFIDTSVIEIVIKLLKESRAAGIQDYTFEMSKFIDEALELLKGETK